MVQFGTSFSTFDNLRKMQSHFKYGLEKDCSCLVIYFNKYNTFSVLTTLPCFVWVWVCDANQLLSKSKFYFHICHKLLKFIIVKLSVQYFFEKQILNWVSDIVNLKIIEVNPNWYLMWQISPEEQFMID